MSWGTAVVLGRGEGICCVQVVEACPALMDYCSHGDDIFLETEMAGEYFLEQTESKASEQAQMLRVWENVKLDCWWKNTFRG